jgi:hypothetical protein
MRDARSTRLLAAYDQALLLLREALAAGSDGGAALAGILGRVGRTLAERAGLGEEEVRWVIGSLHFDLREAARAWHELDLERELLERLRSGDDGVWRELHRFCLGRSQLELGPDA